MPLDRFGRTINYLRISLTDRCNQRCVYCMPEDMTFRPTPELMQDDELLLLVRLFAGLGFEKFRLTGGEPTVRPGIIDLVQEIRATPGVKHLAMTTNGVLLGRLAAPLKEAGLQRVNVSLDTLNPRKYRVLTRRDDFTRAWKGILAAQEAGLAPLKLNAVVVRGRNDEDVAELAGLTYQYPWQMRFIEMMPFAGATELQQTQVVRAGEMIERLQHAFGHLTMLNEGALDGEARLYRLPDAQGTVGFISSVSLPFCATCTRARLTSDGKLRLCLLRDMEVDLLGPLRQGASLDDLRTLILEGVWRKPWGHGLQEGEFATNRVMNEIGG